MINHMIIKATISDGCSASEDQFTILCRNSITPNPTPTITPTPSATPISQNLLILNQANDWTYRFNNQIVIKFIKTVTENVVITVPALDIGLLPQLGQPVNVPNFANINTGSSSIGQLVFIDAYKNQNISIEYSDVNYRNVIKPGAIPI